MTYFKYINHLVTEFSQKRIGVQYSLENLLLMSNHPDPVETKSHLQRVKECHAAADLVESVMLGILDGSICPFDEID
jgi:hypothetical protein